MIRSFDGLLLTYVRELRPDARIHYMAVSRIEHSVHVARRRRFQGVSLFHTVVRPATCTLAHRAGLAMTAGGAPGEGETDRLLRGARLHGNLDYICSNALTQSLARRAAIEAV